MSRRLVMVVVGIGAMAFALAGCFGNGTTATNTGVAGQPGAGLYRTLGDDGGACTITRTDASGTPHTFSNLTGGPIYLRVKPDDKSVTSTHCKLWQLAGLVPPVIEVPFRSGDYRVGYEVQPGTYQASGTSGGADCTYGVVSDFEHDGTDGTPTTVPQPVNGPKPTIIATIQKTDFGFWSQNCGSWTKQ